MIVNFTSLIILQKHIQLAESKSHNPKKLKTKIRSGKRTKLQQLII
jgi:hypothetical protein